MRSSGSWHPVRSATPAIATGKISGRAGSQPLEGVSEDCNEIRAESGGELALGLNFA
jgi:hypothetical protein